MPKCVHCQRLNHCCNTSALVMQSAGKLSVGSGTRMRCFECHDKTLHPPSSRYPAPCLSHSIFCVCLYVCMCVPVFVRAYASVLRYMDVCECMCMYVCADMSMHGMYFHLCVNGYLGVDVWACVRVSCARDVLSTAKALALAMILTIKRRCNPRHTFRREALSRLG